jgi:hypothetical protein
MALTPFVLFEGKPEGAIIRAAEGLFVDRSDGACEPGISRLRP